MRICTVARRLKWHEMEQTETKFKSHAYMGRLLNEQEVLELSCFGVIDNIRTVALPTAHEMDGYVGRSFNEIVMKHIHDNIVTYKFDKQSFVLEIRRDKFTIACLFGNQMCYQAYEFWDEK